MICLTSWSEFGIVSGFLLLKHMFMDSSLSTGSLAIWSQVWLAIKTNPSRCRTGVWLATSADTYSTK